MRNFILFIVGAIMITNQLAGQTVSKKESLTDNEKAVLREYIYPLRTILPDDGDSDDLAILHRLIGDASVVGLGEVTHGSGAIFNTKHRLIRYLISNEDFSLFALEANMPRCYQLNDYIVHGKGDAKDLLRRAQYPIWCTQEMLNLVEWMKTYNHSAPKITFAGFDMLHYTCMMEELQKGFAEEEISPAKAEWLKQNLRLLEQYTIYKTPGTDISTWRDRCFAENIGWIKAQNPDKKMIVWAHNAHVKKSIPTSGGYYLAEKFGKEYVSFGFAFYGGTYTTRGEEGENVTKRAHDAPQGSYEYLLNLIDEPYFILDLKQLKKDNRKETEWIRQVMELRHFGFVPKDTQFFETNLTDDYDYLIFLKESEDAHPF
jgi:erythromycin esterase